MTITYLHTLRVDSTQNWARQLLLSEQKTPFVVTAEEQTAGRGRKGGRQWHSPAVGNLYATFGWIASCGLSNLSSCSLIVSLVVTEYLQHHHIPVLIKWPNDLLVRSKKIGGILIESLDYQGKLGLLIGLGLNVNATEEDLYAVQSPITSLRVESGRVWPCQELVRELGEALISALSLWQQEGFAPFRERYKACFFLRPSDVFSQDGEQMIYRDIAVDGGLEVEAQLGKKRRLVSGEIHT